MMSVASTQSHARAIVKPQSPLLRLPGRHFEAFLTPDPGDALAIHAPAPCLQKCRDALVAVSAVLCRESDRVAAQRRFVIEGATSVALRRPRLADRFACPALGDSQLDGHCRDKAAASRWA